MKGLFDQFLAFLKVCEGRTATKFAMASLPLNVRIERRIGQAIAVIGEKTSSPWRYFPQLRLPHGTGTSRR